MPNWCMNTVDITGDLPKLEAIKAAADDAEARNAQDEKHHVLLLGVVPCGDGA